MPEDVKQGSADDMLESLLVSAAERAAKREAQEALEKGFVTRQDINLALGTFGEQLEEKIVTSVKDALMPQIEGAIQKAESLGAGSRKSTIATPEEAFENDPVAYLIAKGKQEGADSYTDEEKRVIWGLTYKALGQGLEED